MGHVSALAGTIQETSTYVICNINYHMIELVERRLILLDWTTMVDQGQLCRHTGSDQHLLKQDSVVFAVTVFVPDNVVRFVGYAGTLAKFNCFVGQICLYITCKEGNFFFGIVQLCNQLLRLAPELRIQDQMVANGGQIISDDCWPLCGSIGNPKHR